MSRYQRSSPVSAVAGVLALVALVAFCAWVVGRDSTPPATAASVKAEKWLATHKAETVAPVKTVTLIGDSYTVGAGSSDGHGILDAFAQTQPWSVTSRANGGAGYGHAVDGELAQKACAADRCPSYLEAIENIEAADPQIVIVSGGRNDLDETDPAAGVRRFYVALRAALPNAKIYATSPLWDSTRPPAELGDIAAAVRSSVKMVGGTYVDLGQPLTRKPDLISDDGVHPNDQGYAALSAAVTSAWPSR